MQCKEEVDEDSSENGVQDLLELPDLVLAQVVSLVNRRCICIKDDKQRVSFHEQAHGESETMQRMMESIGGVEEELSKEQQYNIALGFYLQERGFFQRSFFIPCNVMGFFIRLVRNSWFVIPCVKVFPCF